MTQIIGVICDDGEKAIAVSDRMITTADLSLAFEHESRKISHISTNCVVLTAGSALVHDPILKAVRLKFKDKPKPLIYDVTNEIKKEYQDLRLKLIEDEIFRARGFTIQDFYKNQKELHDAIVMELNEEMKKYDLGLQMIVLGVDSEGAHLYHVGNPGTATPFSSLGFCCIGTGQQHADRTFAYRKYAVTFPLKKALYIIFEAKKRAEMAGGVGVTTDIAIIDDEGVKYLSEETIEQLSNIYEEMEEKAIYGREVENAVKQLQLQFK